MTGRSDPSSIGRRTLVAGLAAAALCPPLLAQPAAHDRVILLGTKGGPTPGPYRAAPATVLMIGGRGYLVDCGNGTANQLAKAGIPLPLVDQIFVTHNHSDMLSTSARSRC